MTIQPITILGAALCFGLLYFRYKNRPRNSPPRTSGQKLRTVRVLLVVFIAWMAVSFSLQHFIRNLDGARTRNHRYWSASFRPYGRSNRRHHLLTFYTSYV